MDVVNLDVSEMAKDLAREMTDEERGFGLPCFVRHEAAGGPCERPATMFVYGLRFCEVHGEDVRIGTLSEFYFDARESFERMDNGFAPLENAEASHMLDAMSSVLFERLGDLSKGEYDALFAAYPEISELVCLETQRYDYGIVNDEAWPEDIHLEERRKIHTFMRQAYGNGMTWLVEQLEIERESASAQTSFAIQDRNRKVEAMKAR